MQGPPDDPRQVWLPAGASDEPAAFVACGLVAIALAVLGTRRERTWLVALALVIGMTAPAAAMLSRSWWGAFPTLDKAGSYLFYLSGVHFRLFDAADPGTRLIGFGQGHLWIVAALDLVTDPVTAFNVQALFNVVANVACTAMLFAAVSRDRWAGLLLAIPVGANLHVFRDVQWYTIEKSGVYWLPLYALALLRARRGGSAWPAALTFAAMSFYNAYWLVVGAAMGAVALVDAAVERNRALAAAVLASAIAGAPFVAWQAALMAGGTFAGAEDFAARAALDVADAGGWNRLEWSRVADPALVLLAVAGARRQWKLLAVAAVFAALAMGPVSPVYRLVAALPGMWRFAKPESFLWPAWLAAGTAGACALAELGPWRNSRGVKVLGFATVLACWTVQVRMHPVYPGQSARVEVKLDRNWERRLPAAARKAP